MLERRILYVIYATGFLDLFGVSMTIPLLSKHSRELGASPAVIGLIGSLYGGLQLFAGPVVGRWSDRSSRKFVLLFCLCLTALSYALLGVATTVLLVVLARIPAGLFKHSQELSKAYLADVTSKAHHSDVFGKFNSISSVGFVFGPLVGGHLGDQPGGFLVVALLTAAIFLLNLALVAIFVPDSTSRHTSGDRSKCSDADQLKSFEAGDGESKRPERAEGLLLLVRAFREVDWTNLWDIFLVRFLLGFAVLLYRSNLTAILDLSFQASSKVIGYLISYSGLVGTASGFLVGPISSRYRHDDTRLLLHASLAQAASLAGLALAPNMASVVFFMTPLSVANAIARVSATNLTLARGGEGKKGALMGLGASVLSLARMLAPAVGGAAQEVSVYGPGVVSTVVGGVAAGIMAGVVAGPGRGSREYGKQT